MNRTIFLFVSIFLIDSAALVRATHQEAVASVPAGGSLAEAVEMAKHSIRPVEDTPEHWWAQNPSNGLNARFTPDGLHLCVATREDDGNKRRFTTRWRTVGVGYGSSLGIVPSGVVRKSSEHGEQNRVEIARPGLVEWFVNRPEGLEQGWTLSCPPTGGGQDLPLRLEIVLDGDLTADIDDNGKHIVLRDPRGLEALRYEKLKVWDAEGRELTARMTGEGRSIAIEVDDSGALYPLTIDPVFMQETYLKASNTSAGDGFGWAVAIDGDTAVVGAAGEDSAATGVNGDQSDNSEMNSGAAYVFVCSGISWTQQAYLKASNTSGPANGDPEGDKFGVSVAISGDTIVVGAYWEDSAATGVNGNQSDDSAQNAGAAYVFVRDGSTWSQQAFLKASNTGPADQFGGSVSISGDTIVVGAHLADSALSGAAYVFTRSGNDWTQQAYLIASNAGLLDGFGSSVAIDGDTIIAGATGEASATNTINGNQNDNSAPNSGAAYVFLRNGSTWTQQAYLKASNTGASDFFGRSVAISGDSVIVGAEEEDSSATGVNGSQNNNDLQNSGAAYVFTRNGSSWTQQAYLKASNPGANDWFGWRVAIDGHYAVVGAVKESSSAIGTNGDQNNDGAPDAGAAYLFRRSGDIWVQRDYLKASNTASNARFGTNVAISGLVIIVGSDREASPAIGIGGDQNGSGAPGAGAAYAFVESAIPAVMTVQKPSPFRSTMIGRRSRPQYLRISSEGDLPVYNPRVSVSGRNRRDFIISQPQMNIISPGDTATFAVTFRPRVKGSRKATLEIRGTNLYTTHLLTGIGRERVKR